MKQIHFPNGKRNPDGAWNTPVSITSQDEEWEHADSIEYLDCDEHGMDTIENVENDDQMVADQENISCSSSYKSTQPRLRRENIRLKQQVTKLKR